MADAPSTYIKNAGVIKHVTGIQVKEAGAWRTVVKGEVNVLGCLLYTSPSPRDRTRSRMPSSA